MAGGYDSLDWFKDRAKRPAAVIDIGGIAEPQGDCARRRKGSKSARSRRSPEIAERQDGAGEILSAGQSPRAMSQVRRSAMPARIGGNLCRGRALLVLPLRRGLLPRRRNTRATQIRRRDRTARHCLFGASRCRRGLTIRCRHGVGRARLRTWSFTRRRVRRSFRRRNSSSGRPPTSLK